MIDVVFLLIIFFLLSSHLAQRENRIDVDLPQATSGEEDLPSTQPRVTVTVLEDGSVLLAGRPVQLAALPNALRARQDQVGERIELRIRSDRRVPYAIIEPILSGAAEAEIWNVTLESLFGELSSDEAIIYF